MNGPSSVRARLSAIEARFGDGPGAIRPARTPAADFEAAIKHAATAARPTRPPADGPAYEALDLAPGPGAYGNGRIPISALSPVGQTGHRLSAPAARAFEGMTAAATGDGVSIGVNDGYRPIEEQVRLAKVKGLYSQGGLAATPGTSPHGWGVAVDLALDDNALSWMRTNARRYGFVEDVPREPWHWTYRPRLARNSQL